MPIYPYQCPHCGKLKEIVMSIADYETVEMILCGQCLQDDVDTPMVRTYTPLAFRFEGGKPSVNRE